jgi:hypothetical protein
MTFPTFRTTELYQMRGSASMFDPWALFVTGYELEFDNQPAEPEQRET